MNNTHKKPYILIVEDTISLSALYSEALTKANYDVLCVETAKQASDALKQKTPDMDGIEFLKRLRNNGRDDKVIIMTGYGSLKNAIEAMRYNASDFLIKPFQTEKLLESIKKELKGSSLLPPQKTVARATKPPVIRGKHFYGFTGQSMVMQSVYNQIRQAARSDATIFITGESGTGKDICAEAIHQYSPRASHPFIPINCAAIPRDLMESELFGHVKGAFTGAISDREGAASLAYGGTLFLDEIVEMNFDMQTKLLRFLQNLTFTKVGGTKPQTTDIRIICATNRDPLQEIKRGTFREDLYYRLHVIPVDMPPLRARGDDIIQLAESFLHQFTTQEGKIFGAISTTTGAILKHYPWPGNVRQLQNEMRRLAVMYDCRKIDNKMLSPCITDRRSQNALYLSVNQGASEQIIKPLAIAERETIEHAIALCGNNIPKAAAALGVSPSTIYRKKMVWDNDEGTKETSSGAVSY